ncbi:hypothetical protein FOA52_015828 [Chlamydomonas sp. UWO 241]|nr:hypothetical protein FOA52_015828 [Chlamydomonas sp. UWO 241]
MQPLIGGAPICMAPMQGTTVSGTSSMQPHDFDKEALDQNGFPVISLVSGLVSDEFLDLLATKKNAKKRVRALRSKAVASFNKMASDVEIMKELLAMPDPTLRARGNQMASLRVCNFMNCSTAWRHLLCTALGVYSNQDAEAYITAIKQGREPPAPASTKFHVPIQEMQDHVRSHFRQGAAPPPHGSALRDLGLETKRVDKFGDKSTGPNACAQCGAVGAPNVSLKKCSKCSAGPSCATSARRVVVRAAPVDAGPGLLQRLGRVIKEKAAGDFDRFFQGTSKTRERLGLVDELLAFWTLEDYEDTLEELEEALITADFGPKTSLRIVDKVRDAVKAGKVKTSDELRTQLKASIVQLLETRGKNSELALHGTNGGPAVIFIVGVNGAGKTTTIGKLASKFGEEGAKVYLIPGDTFRAAAAEQLAEWASRSNAVMGTFNEGASPESTVRENLAAAIARTGDDKIDLVICDTAGRLHTAYALMEELEAVKKTIASSCSGQPDETLLVLDGTTGLNMLNQAREFNQSVKLTGLILTKLDGTARGGAVVSVVDQLGIPVKFIGVGEKEKDLQPFNAVSFAEALFPSVEAQAAKAAKASK